ncbi:hypothetical protein ACHWQZ_G007612 [Mnemiopsis leidyi]
MARIFAPRIVFQHDRKPTNQNLWITPRDLVMSNQCTLITDPWYNYYSLLYEKNLLEQWSAGLTLPWQVGPHTKLSGFNGSSPARFSGLGGSLSSRFSGLTGSLHGRFSGLIPGIQSRFSAKHRGDRRRGEAHGKWGVIRRVQCSYPSCNKTFGRNEERTRHEKIHLGLKPYQCTKCYKKFGRKDHLKQHNRTHTRQQSLEEEESSNSTNNNKQELQASSSVHDQGNGPDSSTFSDMSGNNNINSAVEREDAKRD